LPALSKRRGSFSSERYKCVLRSRVGSYYLEGGRVGNILNESLPMSDLCNLNAITF